MNDMRHTPEAGNADPASNAPADPQRRRFVQLLGVSGLVIAVGPAGIRRLNAAERLATTLAEPWSPVAYVTVRDDGTVTIICHRSEMGQGIRTTMPMIIADEMEADWSRCRVEQADGNEKKYGSQNTDGSTSVREFLAQYREAGATVRGNTWWCIRRAGARSRSPRWWLRRPRFPCRRRIACASRARPSGAGRERRCRRSTWSR